MMMNDDNNNYGSTKTIQILDDRTILQIISYLNINETMNLLASSKRFSHLFEEDYLYKCLCQSSYFEGDMIVETKPENIKYKEYFLDNIKRIKMYKNVLNKIIAKNMNNETYNYFKDVQKMKPYSNDLPKLKSILDIVQQYYKKVSKDVLILYRVLNGQRELLETQNSVFNNMGLFGMVYYYNTYFNFVFNYFQKPQCGFLEDLKAHPFAYIDPVRKNLFLDVTNQLGFGHQTIYTFAPFKGQDQTMYININHSSIDSFMMKLDNWNWNQEDSFIDLFDTLYHPGSDTTTNGIRIRATAKHIPMDQNNGLDEYFYSYSVRISANNIQGNKQYKLTKRKWVITQDQDISNPEIVVGDGVIGYYPEIYNGCEDFVYQSCSLMPGYTGTMSGSFEFRDLQTNELFEAIIAPFPLRPDRDAKLISYNLSTHQSTVILEDNS